MLASHSRALFTVRENLDKIGVRVKFREAPEGVIILAKNEADRLIAKHEVKESGLKIAPFSE